MKRRARNHDGSWKNKAVDILDAAETVLLEEGHGGLTIQKVCEEASVSTGHLQYYFPNKEELFECLIEKLLEDHIEVWREEGFSEANGCPEDRFKRFIHFHLQSHHTSDLVKLAWDMWSLSAREPFVARSLTKFHMFLVDELDSLIQALASALATNKCRQIAIMIVANLEGMTLFMHETRPVLSELETVSADISARYLNMIKGEEAAE